MHSLFLDFKSADKQLWKEQVLRDLKGKPYETLVWRLPEGIDVEPYYTADELTAFPHPAADIIPPGPEQGGEPRQWVNMQYLAVTDAAMANAQALEALNGGATGILFDLRPLQELPDFHVLLKGILIAHCSISFQVEEIGFKVLSAYLQYVKQQGVGSDQLRGFIAFDPLGYLSETGLMDNDRLREWAQAAKTSIAYPALKGVMLDSGTFHNAGANAVQEIAFLLQLTSEYLHRLTELGVSPAEAFQNMGFSVALGGRFFVEIAKLRAIRLLIAQMAHAYGLADFSPADVYIHAYTGRWSKSRLDVDTNLLRNTTEAMSGVLGGCNALTVMPHTAVLGKIDNFSMRMARNISTILQEEAYFGKVVDPVAGAYYPEVLTSKLAEKSWKLFLELEEEGGFSKMVEKGKLQKLIEKERRQRNADIESRKQRVVGANYYANPAETPNLPVSLYDTDADGMILRQQGQADAFELMRRRSLEFRQKKNRLPQVLLLQFGDPAMSRARAAFAADFMQTAGFRATEMQLKEGENPISLLSGELPEVVVLCAADEDYNQQAVWLADQLRQCFSGVLLVAGNSDMLSPDIKNAAIDGFIHLKSNVVRVLTEVQDKIFDPHEAKL